MRQRIAIVATHPIQYYAPWFAHIAVRPELEARVFYLWDFGVAGHRDAGFGVPVTWDLPLLEGYEHEFVPNRSSRPGTERFLGLWNPTLPERLGAWNPDAILLTTYNYASIALLLKSRRGNDAPLIFRGDSHRLAPRRGMKEAMRRKLIGAVFRRFSAALYVGTANRDYLAMHGITAERLFHSPHAVDNARFFAARAAAEAEAAQWRASLGIPAGRKLILFAGKFQAIKRPLDLLHAFRAAKLDGVSVLFVGSGEQETELRNAAAGVQNVHFAPFRNQTLMPATYAACDLLVLPSLAETWGLAVNEAMCMSRPAIVSDRVGCAHDLVRHGETGLVFAMGDVAALADALRFSFADPARLATWGINARRHVESYDYEHATGGLLSAIRFARPIPA